jgi:hypothetical protein
VDLPKAYPSIEVRISTSNVSTIVNGNAMRSTDQHQSGILMDVQPTPPWNTEASQPQLHRFGPSGGQPPENS